MSVKEKRTLSKGMVSYIVYESILSKPIHNIWHTILYLKYKSLALSKELGAIPRRVGIKDSRYLALKELKGKYKGKRLFITCTGPSLTISDLELLKDEYVFGMNSICLIHDKTDWKPDFFGIQDRNVYVRIKDALLNTNNGLVFAPYSYNKIYSTPDNWIYFDISGEYNYYEMEYQHKYFTKFSNNCYATCYGGYSITYTIMQLAFYLGFDELYLIGADCSYLGQKQHFIDHGHVEMTPVEQAKKLNVSYSVAKDFAERHGVKIYNATRGGCLELFPRVQLEEVLARSEKNKNNL